MISIEYIIMSNMQMECSGTFSHNSSPTQKCDKMASAQVEKFSLRLNERKRDEHRIITQ